MNIDNKDEQLLESEQLPIGARLKLFREAAQLTELDIADSLKLRVMVIRQIESGEYDKTQPSTFIRGYIRSYAKLLGLDGNAMLLQHEQLYGDEQQHLKMESFSGKTHQKKYENRIMSITWLVLLVIFGVTALVWWQNKPSDIADEPLINTDQDQILVEPISPALQDTVPDPKNEPDTPSNESDLNDDAILTAATNNPVQVIDEVESFRVSSVPSVVNQNIQNIIAENELLLPNDSNKSNANNVMDALSMTFRGDCWIEVYDSAGKRLVAGIKSQNDNLNVSGQGPFKVILGAPDVVDLVYNGAKVDIPVPQRGTVARFTLPN